MPWDNAYATQKSRPGAEALLSRQFSKGQTSCARYTAQQGLAHQGIGNGIYNVANLEAIVNSQKREFDSEKPASRK